MTDLDIRVLTDDQYRAAHTLFRGTLHHGPANDERWASVVSSYEPGRAWGAFAGDELVGTVMSFPSAIAVPGGAVLPMAAVSRVGVRADWTRRGALTALQRAQLRSFLESGQVVSTLRATEGVIYGRYGYGVATRFRHVRVRRAGAKSRLPVAGRVRLLEREAAVPVVQAVYERVAPRRPGTAARWQGWWQVNVVQPPEDENLKFAVASGPDGDDGFLVYKVTPGSHEAGNERPAVLTVLDLWTATPRAWADLWAFTLGVDLVDEIDAVGRPVDEPLDWLLVDRRAARVVSEVDETWLRVVDVEAALSARAYRSGDPVVIGVRDRVLPENEGAYRITAEGAVRTGEEPDFVVDVEVLGAAYLGDVTFRSLALAGRFTPTSREAVDRADALFAVDEAPWCGTYF
ncbi:GNAT family N-acetyltransferase [Saccharothrix obliqua]|uniref:GNAT family N-acetyltransferase n=1 Tax=Saccharothrix obliqua TaxID=2861747 RepID=UPI001C5CE141|nr:GNAT family N-acetyltransferase [Saccharothrix obliqua]MBW4717702.1 GNAT family N-acetyltransferase [Saccharothrix obliqua]